MAHLENARKRSETGSKFVDLIQKNSKRLAQLVDYLGAWLALIIVVTFLLWWEFISRSGRVSALFFPAPTTIAATLVDMTLSGELAEDFFPTLKRVLSGFVIGGGAGLLLGLSMGWSIRLRTALDPIIAALHPIPKISLLPIFLIIFGFGETSRIVMVSVSAFFPMLINSMAGVLQINPTYFEVAKNYGASHWKIFRRVVLPGSLPLVLTGARLSLTIALVITIVIELRFGNVGLGTVIWLAWETLRTNNLYAVVAVLAALGMSFNISLLWLKKYLVPWHEEIRT